LVERSTFDDDICVFQPIVITDSRPSWSPIPEHRDHRFQPIAIAISSDHDRGQPGGVHRWQSATGV